LKRLLVLYSLIASNSMRFRLSVLVDCRAALESPPCACMSTHAPGVSAPRETAVTR
jgi:hypothetical protein